MGYSNQHSFTDPKPSNQLSNPYTYPSSYKIINFDINDTNLIKYINNDNSIVHRTKHKVIEKINSKMKTKRKEYSSGIKVSNEKNLTARDHQNLFKDKKNLSLTSRHLLQSEPPPRRRIPRQASSQNVFQNNRNKSHSFFQSSGIEFLNPLDGDSGMFLPEVDYGPDLSSYEFVTEMSDKEFESLGFPVSPKPTDSYRLSGSDHDYGDHYDTDTGGFSGIEIISREFLCCIESEEQQTYHL